MGYDKPDLGFVVHYQAPGSVISYYQQVGRAGRGVEHADVVLLRGREDRRIQDFFIEQAFPPRELVERVLEALDGAGEDGLSLPALTGVVNLGRARIEAMLKVLDVEGAVDARRQPLGAAARARTWSYDADRYAAGDRAAPARAGRDGGVRRRRALPDARAAGGARRSRAARLRPLRGLRGRALRRRRSIRRWCAQAALHLRSKPLVLEVKKMAPGEDGAMRKLPEDVRAEEGRALARLGDGGWDPLVQAGRRAGRFDDELVDAAAEAVRGWGAPVAWVAAVPSRRSGRAGAGLRRSGSPPRSACRSRRCSSAPATGRRSARWPTPPSRSPTCAASSRSRGELPAGPCLLVDDVRFSGWTLAMLAGQLRRRGAPAVYPLALTTAY